MNKKKRSILVFLLLLCLIFPGCAGESSQGEESAPEEPPAVSQEDGAQEIDEVIQSAGEAADIQIAEALSPADVPEYNGDPFITVNNNVPAFTEEDLDTASFESYSELDELGRCGEAYADIGEDLMPTEKRGSISKVKPSGWHSIEYDIVDGKSLYNRCHLIGYQLTAENANEQNLITGTRYLNTEGMLPFENMVADYIKETGNHVLYRVTPIFEEDNLVANGVQMEAMSVEDEGEEILFNVYCYNVQPGITIDYETGDSQLAEGSGDAAQNTADLDERNDEEDAEEEDDRNGEAKPKETVGVTYILNTNTRKFHVPSCSSVKQMKESNTEEYTGSRDELAAMGYDPCKRCKP